MARACPEPETARTPRASTALSRHRKEWAATSPCGVEDDYVQAQIHNKFTSDGLHPAGDIEALEETPRVLLEEMNPEEAWRHLRPYVEGVLERAGGLWPLAEEKVAEMLRKYGVKRF